MDDYQTELSGLITQVMDREGYRSLKEMSRHTAIPYQTLYAWLNKTRGMRRPPAPEILRRFAQDFRVPESSVFRAAGRIYPDPDALDPDTSELVGLFRDLPEQDRAAALKIVHLYRDLPPEDQEIVARLMRDLRGRDQSETERTA